MRATILICFFLLLVCRIRSQNYIGYTTDDGLPSNEVYCSVIDKQGYIWFGTDVGVVFYNGIKFHSYNTGDGLTNNTIFSMAVDPDGKIWMAGFDNSVGFFENGVFHQIKGKDGKKFILPSIHYINDIKCEGEYVYFPVMEKIFRLPYKKPENAPEEIQIGSKACFSMIAFGNQWFIISNEKNRHRKETYADIEIFIDGKSQGIHELHFQEKSGDIIFTKSERIDKERVAITLGRQLFLYENGQFNGIYTGGSNLISIIRMKRGFGVSERGKGITFFSPGKSLDDPIYNYLLEHTITSRTVDYEGSHWFTTLENGVLYVPGTDQLKYGLNDPECRQISSVVSWKEFLFAGTKEGMLYYMNPENGKAFRKFISSHPIFYIFDGTEYLIVGSTDGTRMYELNGDSLIQIINHDCRYRSVCRISKGEYLGVMKGNLYRFNDKSCGIKAELPIKECFSIFHDPEKRKTLIGTMKGLFEYRNGKLFQLRLGEKLDSERVDMIKKDPYGRLWLATKNNGIFILKNNRVVIHFTILEGLLDNHIRSITFSKKNAYVGTHNGISRITGIDKITNTIINSFTEYDGLPDKRVNSLHQYDGWLLIGTEKTFEYLREGELLANMIAPSIYIDQFVNLKTNLPGNIFDHDQNDILIEFGINGFKTGKKTRIKYQLHEGDEFHYLDGSGRLELPGLAPGEYKITAYAINNNGVWSEKPAVIRFTIRKPIYKETWFLLITLFVLSIAGVFYFRFRMMKIKDRAREKSEMVLRIEELKLEALQMNMNPHFIFNSLNSIQHYIIKNKKEEAYHFLELFASMIRNILEQSRLKEIDFDTELETLKMYVELEKMRLDGELDVIWEIDPTLPGSVVKLPPLLIQPFVENAIWHGLMPKEKNRRLEISFRKGQSGVVCTITDNGIGRKTAFENKSSVKKQSLGMEITKRRFEGFLFHGYDYSLKISDRENDGSGTIVELIIPLKKRNEN